MAIDNIGKFAVFMICVMYFVDNAYAISCYECNSAPKAHGKQCEEGPFTDFEMTDCETKNGKDGNNTYSFCRKIDQTLNGERTIIRQCAADYTDPPTKCIQRLGTFQVQMFYCHCEGDFCNGASGLRLVLALVLLPMLALFASRP